MAISFDTIPNVLVPGHYTETNADRAAAGSPALPKRMLVVGQRLTTGTVAANTPFRVFSSGDGDKSAGVGSMLAEMLRVVKEAYPSLELYGVGLADAGGGVKANGEFTISGTATEAGSIVLYTGTYRVGSTTRGRYTVPVASGDTAAAIATAAAAIINADPYRCVDAVANVGALEITARQAGVLGNSIALKHSFYEGESLPAGIAIALVAMTSGATNPAVGTAIANMGDKHFSHVVNPYNDTTSVAAFVIEAVRRWGGTVQRECQLFGAANGSLSDLTTLGDAQNSQFNSIMGVGLSPSPSWIVAADYAAVVAFETHPGRPFLGKTLKSMIAPANGDEFTSDEREQLLAEGISTFLVDAGGLCSIERAVTTHQEDQFGNPTSVYRDIQVISLLFAIRYDWRLFLAARYPRHMHAADRTIYGPGLPIVQPSTIKAEFAGRARNVWAKDQGWMESPDQFEEDIVIERVEDGFDMIGVPDLINRFHVSRTRFDFLR